jgi:outer membrane protein assembly factor BamB
LVCVVSVPQKVVFKIIGRRRDSLGLTGRTLNLKSFFLSLLIVEACCRGMASDWATFLGPHSNGTSDETGLLDSFPTNGPVIQWSRKLGTGYGAPSVFGDRLIVHHRLENEEIVEALNPTNGESIWHYGYPSRFQDPYGYNNGPRSSPLIHEGRCYTFGAEGKLLCLELLTGKMVWQINTAAVWDIPPAFFGVGTSPIMVDNKLIVMVGGQTNSCVVALEPGTGKILWEAVGQKNWEGQPMFGWPGQPFVKWRPTEKQASYSTPVSATIHGKHHLLCLTRQGLVSLNPTNGAVNFSFWFRSPANDSVNAMMPIVSGDLIFVSAAYYRIGSVLLRVHADGQAFDEIWRGTGLEMHWSTPILNDGFLYGFSGRNEPDAHFRCAEFLTGKVAWDRDESWPIHSSPTPAVFGRGSCLRADGKLWALGEGGLLGIFKLSSKACEEVCRAQVPGLHHPCWAAPVLANKRLYLRSEDRLVCLNIASSEKPQSKP